MIENKKLNAVIFDLDGTLLDTLKDIGEAMNRALRSLGYPTYPISAYRQFVGEGATVLAEKVLPPEERNEEKIQLLRSLFIEDYRSNWKVHTRPYPGIEDLLDALTRLGIPMAVFSNKPHYFTRACVETFLSAWEFELVLGEGEECPRKPDPSGALKIADSIGKAPDEIMFVGDTKIDMQTARNAGMVPCGVTWGFRTRDELQDHGAAYIVDHPMEIESIIRIQKDG